MTLHGFFQECAKRYQGKSALMVKREGRYREISWREMESSVRKLALGLSALGVEKGDRVAILSENRPEWPVSDLAVLSEGAVTVPVYPTSTSRQIAYVLDDSEAKVLIVSTAEQLRKIREVESTLSVQPKVVVMDPVEDPGAIPLDRLLRQGAELAAGDPGLYERHAARTVDSDTATVIYTSGTTGEPKGVLLSHENILFNCKASECVVPIEEGDLCLSFLPLSHVFERTVGQFFMLFHGVTIAYAESIDSVADNLAEVRPTLVVSVPRLYEKMYARVLEKVRRSPRIRQKIFAWGIETGKQLTPYRLKREQGPFWLRMEFALADRLVFHKIKERLGGRLRYFISGGAPLSRKIAEFFYAAGVTILEGYGLTETSPVITANRHDKIRFGTIGPALPGVEVKIAEDGEILTRSPSVMKGYFKNETATRESIDPEGWFHTGDIGEIDEEGFVRITDRKKDLIVTSGGKNIAPQYIESLLLSDDYFSQVMVYGDRRKYLTALVVPAFETLSKYFREKGVTFSSRQEMLHDPRTYDFLMSRVIRKQRTMARFEQLKKIALLDHEWTQEAGELTPTLKIRRKVITKRYFDLLDALYENEF